MKNLVFAFALLCSTSLVAQFSFNANGSGIQTPYSTASGNFSTAMGASTTASGNYSTAMGSSSTASGEYSTAMGVLTTASGPISTAMGDYTTASGTNSTAMGYETTASGGFSTAIGLRTKAQDYGTTAIGVHNETKETPNPENFSYQNTAFVIGNGGYDNNGNYDGHFSNAFEVLFDGSTTIAGNVTAPAFIGDGSQLTNLPTPTVDYNDITNVPLSFNATSGNGIESATNTASGNTSTAMGSYTTASGLVSTAMGVETKASGGYSTAMGYLTEANGILSTAMGWYTVAQDFGTIATGIFNETDETPEPTTFTLQNTALVIGNGTDDENRSNAFEVLFDGTTTIAGNVTAPAFIGDGSQLTNIPFKYNSMGNQGIQSPTNTASGYLSIAMGINTQSSGEYSTATGWETTASGYTSTAMGERTTASGFISTAMGVNTEASGAYSTALGVETNANGDYSTALGVTTKASGNASTAMGALTTASGFVSTALGELTEASGSFSAAMGQGTSAQDYGTTAIGIFNKTKETSNPDQYSLQNTAFVIGNGLSDNRSNAFEVLFDGTTTIAGDLNINSDARLKANIISLGATLSKLLQIDGKTYTMKKDANHKKKIGLLAQDIEKVFPELVTETNDIKSVNYQGLVPVLINAMKEQQEEIERLKKQDEINKKQQQKIDTYKKELDELKTMVKQLISK